MFSLLNQFSWWAKKQPIYSPSFPQGLIKWPISKKFQVFSFIGPVKRWRDTASCFPDTRSSWEGRGPFSYKLFFVLLCVACGRSMRLKCHRKVESPCTYRIAMTEGCFQVLGLKILMAGWWDPVSPGLIPGLAWPPVQHGGFLWFAPQKDPADSTA